jgi:DNA-binding MarR family transcriptional regulator
MKTRTIQAVHLARLVEQTSRAIHSRGHSHGLFPAQWTALRYFAGAEPALRSASALAAYQGMAFGPVSRTVRTLIAKGFLRKSAPTPGRFEFVEVTETGHALLASDPMAAVVAALDGLSAPDRQVLAAALEAVLLRLQGADGDEGLIPEA